MNRIAICIFFFQMGFAFHLFLDIRKKRQQAIIREARDRNNLARIDKWQDSVTEAHAFLSIKIDQMEKQIKHDFNH